MRVETAFKIRPHRRNFQRRLHLAEQGSPPKDLQHLLEVILIIGAQAGAPTVDLFIAVR